MTVSLTPELEKLVAKQIASGRFHSPEEVMREGLRLVIEQQEIRELGLEELRREVATGLEQLKRGEKVSGDQAFAELREHSRAWRERHG